MGWEVRTTKDQANTRELRSLTRVFVKARVVLILIPRSVSSLHGYIVMTPTQGILHGCFASPDQEFRRLADGLNSFTFGGISLAIQLALRSSRQWNHATCTM